MRYFTIQEARRLAKSATTSRAPQKVLKEESDQYRSSQTYDVFLSHAFSDAELVLGAKKILENEGFRVYVDWIEDPMSVKEPWDSAWKTNCRTRIKGCHGVIVLVTKNTIQAEGARWEIKCAIEERIPVMPMYASNNDKGCRLPPELEGMRIYDWSWPNLKNFVGNLG